MPQHTSEGSMTRSTWHRVNRAHPCPICRKADWCGYDSTGATCCMRVPSDRQAGNGGWIHGGGAETRANAPVARRMPDAYEDPGFDAATWWRAARHVARPHKLTAWAARLGLPVMSIDFMGACHLGGVLAFPMHDGHGNVCGIRTRLPSGEKRAVTGSRAGVFVATLQTEDDVMICEGPTDAAAAMALGFEPIGRPSCAGQERHVVDTLRRWGRDRATICADADGPGIAGATRLADVLRAARIAVRLVAPVGHKDLRDWWRAGARRETVDAAWSQAAWR